MDGETQERRARVDAVTSGVGGTATWRRSIALDRSYALLELPSATDAAAIAEASGETVYAKPVIALALFPAVPEALSPLVEALAGAGGPAGVLSCASRAGAAIVEWDPEVTATPVIVELIDLELARFRSARIAELLSPLPASLLARIAAEGLQAPQIDPNRILELRIDRA